MKFETKLNKILAMPDSDLKLTKLNSLGLSIGIFNKEPIIKEGKRLFDLGYRDLALRYLEQLEQKEKEKRG